jgi:hypothetical protein
LGKKKQVLQLTDKHGEDGNDKAVEKGRKNITVKISGCKIKQVDRFIYLGSVVEKNNKIQNEINNKKRKAS